MKETGSRCGQTGCKPASYTVELIATWLAVWPIYLYSVAVHEVGGRSLEESYQVLAISKLRVNAIDRTPDGVSVSVSRDLASSVRANSFSAVKTSFRGGVLRSLRPSSCRLVSSASVLSPDPPKMPRGLSDRRHSVRHAGAYSGIFVGSDESRGSFRVSAPFSFLFCPCRLACRNRH